MSIEVVEVEPGAGDEAVDESRVTIRYEARLDGEAIDAGPLTFEIGMGEVIEGLERGVTGMRPGGRRRLTIPPELAYGDRGAPKVPAGATLEFEVTLLSVTK